MTVECAKPDRQEWWEQAQSFLPGGVNATARLSRVLGKPFLVSHGTGGTVVDHQGRQYIDLNMSFGASLLGYRHPAIRKAVQQASDEGLLCGHETLHPISVARMLAQLIPSAEMTRFCCTGTETTWHAIRFARAHTNKSVIVKFEGHFHGYHDYLGYSSWPPTGAAGPPDSPVPYPETSGIPTALHEFVAVLPFNDVDALENLFRLRHHEIAAVIMEAVNYNSGTILPQPGYLQRVRELTNQYNVLLIFDEILSGFRTGIDCMQGYFNVVPDLTTLGKALGGGTPLSAVVGKREIMARIAPKGQVMHSGTYIAHPILVLAAEAFLTEASKPDFYPELLNRCERLHDGLVGVFREAGVAVKVQALGARFSLLFGIPQEQQVLNYRDAAKCDHDLAHQFYRLAFEEGVYFHPGWHHGISIAHTDEQIDIVLDSIERAVRRLKRSSRPDRL